MILYDKLREDILKKEYLTIQRAYTFELIEKKSRFIASVLPISNEDEAIAFVNSLKSRYWDATHNVYAYLIDQDITLQRFSDDGEPSGTAGLPVLEVIKKLNINDVVIVVTRYFGGIRLGAAGLIRAYGKVAQLALEEAQIIKKALCYEAIVTIEYTLLGKVQAIMINEGFPIKDIKYGENVDIVVYIPVEKKEHFAKLIIEITSARVILGWEGKEYITM